MMKNLKILIANDDGIRSEGIAHLARAAAQFGSVWVAAPERQCSGMSVRLTISETSEMAVYRYDFPAPVEAAWSVDGTPADCLKVALHVLLPFTHSMMAMRECIAGFYENTYWVELGNLCWYLAASLLLGLVLRKPIIRLNDAFNEKLEETKVI